MTSPEQKTIKVTTLIICYQVLGQVAAKRGNLDEADGHFAKAMEYAKLSRMPMFEVLVARDWKKHLLEPNGRDCSAAEAVIDGACAKMKKTRGQLRHILGSRLLSNGLIYRRGLKAGRRSPSFSL